jgi:hypothetical protein
MTTGIESTARIVATSAQREGVKELEDWFPGRWSPRRAIQDDLRVVAQAVANATKAAGWWTAGQTVDAGLVVGIDLHGWGPMSRWIASLADHSEGKTLRPSVFLHALPSTPASTLGLLFGLERYQATLDMGPLSGVAALAHALDQLTLGRLERVVVASLSAVDPAVAARLPQPLAGEVDAFRLGVALCLEQGQGVTCRVSQRGEPPADAVSSDTLLDDLPSGYRMLAAPSLLAVLRANDAGMKQSVAHRDPCFGGLGIVSLEGS